MKWSVHFFFHLPLFYSW